MKCRQARDALWRMKKFHINWLNNSNIQRDESSAAVYPLLYYNSAWKCKDTEEGIIRHYTHSKINPANSQTSSGRVSVVAMYRGREEDGAKLNFTLNV